MQARPAGRRRAAGDDADPSPSDAVVEARRARQPGPPVSVRSAKHAAVKQSHWLPRSRDGRIAVILFVALMALAQPPVVHRLVNRIEPWVLGLPFLYVWLLGVYLAMIGVLLWAQRRGL